ncbi:T9SS type A sorting domain-containing protein, partial [Winogradskyella sp. DF17]
DVTGQITVDCANTDPNNPTPTVAVFEVQGAELSIDNSISQNNEVLTANESGPGITYQWIDCNNGNAPLPNETNQSFTATINGSYAVIISNTACATSVTSDCVNIDSLSINDVPDNFEVQFYPNPVESDLNIQFGSTHAQVDIEVYSLLGQKVSTVSLENSSNHQLDLSELPGGSYILRIIADGNTITKTILKH